MNMNFNINNFSEISNTLLVGVHVHTVDVDVL